MKQRLIGAAVLVALVVIFVPMMLNGPIERPVVEVPLEIPVKPITQKRALEEITEGDKLSKSIPEVSSERPITQEPKQMPKKVGKPVFKTEKISGKGLDKKINKPIITEKSKNSDDKVASKSEPASSGTASSKKSASTTSKQEAKKQDEGKISKYKGSLEAWDIQVGSFSSSKNGLALRDKLRKKGYRAYVESLVVDNKKMYRVRVGPELSKDKAEKNAKKLRDIEKLPAKIYKH